METMTATKPSDETIDSVLKENLSIFIIAKNYRMATDIQEECEDAIKEVGFKIKSIWQYARSQHEFEGPVDDIGATVAVIKHYDSKSAGHNPLKRNAYGVLVQLRGTSQEILHDCREHLGQRTAQIKKDYLL